MKKTKSRVSASMSSQVTTWCLSALCLGAFSVSTAVADSSTIYKETFPYCTGSIGKDAAAETGWIALVSGLPQAKISNLKVFSYGSNAIGGDVNSSPQGKSQGYTFWFRPVYGLSFLTAEMSFDVSLISQQPALVEYEQRLSGVDEAGVPNETQLLFLVDNQWYISETAARQNRPGIWEPVKIDPSQLKYGVVPYVAPLGAQIPAAYTESLPATGKVKAFGVFVGKVNGRVRIDNFSIQTSATVPSSIVLATRTPTFSGCPESSPDRTGDVVPTPTPDPDDGDSGTDYGTPDPTPTPITTPPQVGPKFCPVAEQGAGQRVNIPAAARTPFTSAGFSKGVVGLRDRAIAQIYAARSIPLGALVNLRAMDYNGRRGTLKVTLRKGAAPKSIKLSRVARVALNRYIAASGAGKAATDPLFVAAIKRGKSLEVKSAMCAREIKRLVTRRARMAKLSMRGISAR